MAVSWVGWGVGWMDDCWAERMVTPRVSSRPGYIAARIATYRTD